MPALRIETAELALATLDALDVDSLAVFIGPERPLQGLAAWVDWRLCGALSAALRGGFYGAGAGEALLLPTAGRLGPPRVFCFGLPALPLGREGGIAVAREGCAALARAGVRSVATALPPVDGGAARPWLEASLAHPVARQVILGDARALLQELAAARDALGAAVELAPHAEPRAPGVALPGGSPVVR